MRCARVTLVVLLWLACAGAVACAEAVAGARQHKERSTEPADVVLQVGSMRYEALHWGRAAGFGQNGGIVKASELPSGRMLWVRRIYTHLNPRGIEGDKADIFITAIEAAPDGGHLLITNERGARFRLDLATLAVRELARVKPRPLTTRRFRPASLRCGPTTSRRPSRRSHTAPACVRRRMAPRP